MLCKHGSCKINANAWTARLTIRKLQNRSDIGSNKSQRRTAEAIENNTNKEIEP